MSKRPSKKKAGVSGNSKSPAARASRRAGSTLDAGREFTFGRETYIWMGIGFGLILIGLLLMSGGAMPDDNTWDESIIYSPMRTLIAPIVILTGLVVEVYAIFKK